MDMDPVVLLAILATTCDRLARATKQHVLAEFVAPRASHKRLESDITEINTAVPHTDGFPFLRICNHDGRCK